MAEFKKGDTVFFSSVSMLVAEGTVEEIQGPYIKVKSRCPGVTHVMASQAFPTKDELRKSKAFHSAWMARQQRTNARQSLTRMAGISLF